MKRAGKAILQQHEEEMTHRVTVLGEIVSTTGFTAQNTYILYDLFLPEQGWLFEDINETEMYGIIRDNSVEYNKRKSVTHISQGRVEMSEDLEDEDTTKFTSHFCFPFDYQFLAKDSAFANSRPYILL